MEFSDVIAQRRSVRTFTDAPVTDEELAPILHAARLAPSAHNRQLTRFVVVRDRAQLDAVTRMQSAANGKWINRWLAKAPALIVACGDTTVSDSHHGVEFWRIDAAIALEHMMLAAVDGGLGSCWVGAFDEQAVRTALGIPAQHGILAMLALGHPATKMSSAERATRAVVRADRRPPLAELVHWERW